MRDAVVVGAGPAGLWFGIKAAEKGLDVIVLDKKQEIGSPVRCAEGFGLEGFRKLSIEPDPKWRGWKVKGAIVYAPSGKGIEIRGDGYVIDRKVFERELAKELVRKGGEIRVMRDAHSVTEFDGEGRTVRASFLGVPEEYRGRVVVAADGFESKIARSAGMNTTQTAYHVDSGFEYVMTGLDIDADHIHLFFGHSIAPRGYVWIFPTDSDTANVGIGIDARSPKSAKAYLDEWIAKHGRDYGITSSSVIEVRAGGIPVGGLLRDLTLDGFLVVGDAAHQVHPLHGGGMFLAMEAAAMAADVVADAVSAGDVTNNSLSEYSRRWWAERGKELEKLVRIRQAFEKMGDDDMNFLAEILTPEEILAISEGEVSTLKLIAQKLIKHPQLLTIFSRLI